MNLPDRATVSGRLWGVAEQDIIAEMICCEPLEPDHDFCAQGYAALESAKALLVDTPGQGAAPLLDAVMQLLGAQVQLNQRPDELTILAARHLDATEGPVQVGRYVDRSTRSAIDQVLRYVAQVHNSRASTSVEACGHRGCNHPESVHSRLSDHWAQKNPGQTWCRACNRPCSYQTRVKIRELPHQSVEEEDACEEQRIAYLPGAAETEEKPVLNITPFIGAALDADEQVKTTEPEPDTPRCGHCIHPKADHSDRGDQWVSRIVPRRPWCHACDETCDYTPIGDMTQHPMTLTFRYRNHRGESTNRTVLPLRIWHGSTKWHPEPQWLLQAYDTGRDAMRDFAVSGMQGTPVTGTTETIHVEPTSTDTGHASQSDAPAQTAPKAKGWGGVRGE